MKTTKFTPGKWKFEPMAVHAEMERVTGITKPEHEKYFRDNNGDWIVFCEEGRLAAVTFRGKAKRGQGYMSPDPEGMDNARVMSASKDLYEALEALIFHLRANPQTSATELLDAVTAGEAALAKARGEE